MKIVTARINAHAPIMIRTAMRSRGAIAAWVGRWTVTITARISTPMQLRFTVTALTKIAEGAMTAPVLIEMVTGTPAQHRYALPALIAMTW